MAHHAWPFTIWSKSKISIPCRKHHRVPGVPFLQDLEGGRPVLSELMHKGGPMRFWILRYLGMAMTWSGVMALSAELELSLTATVLLLLSLGGVLFWAVGVARTLR